MILLLVLAGCESTLSGVVQDADGAPLAGAVLDAGEACRAVTDAQGRFRVRCEPATWTFRVTHPDCLDGTWAVAAEDSGELDVGRFSLVRIPVADGLHLLDDGRFAPLPAAPLRRTSDDREQRWCLDRASGAPAEVVGGTVRLLDNHVADWRVFRVDAQGCAYRLRRGDGEHWSFTADRVHPSAETPLAQGRTWVDLPLPAGEYVVAEWYEGFLVRADADSWKAGWVRSR